MRVLIVGGLGSIGARYQAILQWLGIDCLVADIANEKSMEAMHGNYDKAIICTPTDLHVNYCADFLSRGIPFLCEKPVSKKRDECKDIAVAAKNKKAFVVNNYAYALNSYARPFTLTYDYFRTGKDGILWDCCQLLVLDPKAKLTNKSPVWNLMNYTRTVSFRDLEQSYVTMIRDFVKERYDHLWPIQYGVTMADCVYGRLNENLDRNSGENKQHAFAR